MGKLSRGSQDQRYIDSGLLLAQWHCLFPVPAMVQETCQWSDYRSSIDSRFSNRIINDIGGPTSFSASVRPCKCKGEICEYRVLQLSQFWHTRLRFIWVSLFSFWGVCFCWGYWLTARLSFNKNLPKSLVDTKFIRIFAPLEEEPVPKTVSFFYRFWTQ